MISIGCPTNPIKLLYRAALGLILSQKHGLYLDSFHLERLLSPQTGRRILSPLVEIDGNWPRLRGLNEVMRDLIARPPVGHLRLRGEFRRSDLLLNHRDLFLPVLLRLIEFASQCSEHPTKVIVLSRVRTVADGRESPKAAGMQWEIRPTFDTLRRAIPTQDFHQYTAVTPYVALNGLEPLREAGIQIKHCGLFASLARAAQSEELLVFEDGLGFWSSVVAGSARVTMFGTDREDTA